MTNAATTGRLAVAFWLALTPASVGLLFVDRSPQAPATATLKLPLEAGSVRFAVMGDTGRGTPEQYAVAQQMVAFHGKFPFDLVIMLGDNIYGSDTPAEMANKFSTPYRPLLAAGVVFRAVLGNHDNPSQRFFAPFNMGGERYYTFPARAADGELAARAFGGEGEAPAEGGVSFFAIDTDYLDEAQIAWLEKELAASRADWKIAFFHHPLYSSGKTHGSALESRAILEPLFVRYGVGAAFSGHDHFYERIKPQKGGTVYWVSGAGGSLRKGDIRATDMTAKGFDRDYHFMLVEIAGDDLYFQAISRTGETIDSGVVHRSGAPAVAASDAPPTPVTVSQPR